MSDWVKRLKEGSRGGNGVTVEAHSSGQITVETSPDSNRRAYRDRGYYNAGSNAG
ncbi:MAG TPA: hypothetical protein V6D29_21530 [Leptolyngbyaceae cyanobacterium]